MLCQLDRHLIMLPLTIRANRFVRLNSGVDLRRLIFESEFSQFGSIRSFRLCQTFFNPLFERLFFE